MLLLGACATTDEKRPNYSLTFHVPAGEMDPPKTMFPMELNGRRMFFKVVPEFSQQNIIAFHPFPSESGSGSGAVFQLDFRGKSELEIISRTRRDEYLLTMLNGQPVDYVVLDQPVLDGVVTVWQGLTDEVIKEMGKRIQRIRKDGGAPSASENMEMRPTTTGEKVRAFRKAKREEEAAKSGKKPETPAVPSLNLPSAPVSPQIPVEGAAPVPAPVPPVPVPAPAPGSVVPPVTPPAPGGARLPLPKP